MSEHLLLEADCLAVLRESPECSFDAVVTDPPYGLNFMALDWDEAGISFSAQFWREVLRVLKPGGHILAFGGTRTYHRMTCALEDAGAQIRDCVFWLYGQGFPKSLNVAKAGAHLEDAQTWNGWGSALKPACEPIVLARKRLSGTMVENLQTYGTGGLNIDGCRIGTEQIEQGRFGRNVEASGAIALEGGDLKASDARTFASGRWPANVLLDEDAAAELDAQTGTLRAGEHPAKRNAKNGDVMKTGLGAYDGKQRVVLDSGGASRFFYVAKPPRSEKDRGCEALPPKTGGEATGRVDGSAGVDNPRAGAGRTGGARNFHPTVKPVELMRYLVRLVTPPGGTVLDPFAGSGTTGVAAVQEGVRFVGIECDAGYCTIARARLDAATAQLELATGNGPGRASASFSRAGAASTFQKERNT